MDFHLKYTDELHTAVDEWNGKPGVPSHKNWKKKDGIPVLANSLLERTIGTAHPSFPGFWTIPTCIVTFYIAQLELGWTVASTLFILGVLILTLFEYALHRFLFHKEVDISDREEKLRQFMFHGYHHEFPNDRMRLVAPVIMIAPLAGILGLMIYFVFGETYWLPVFSGAVFGYLCYDWVHYYTHHFQPKSGVGKFLRDYHLAHHFKNQDSHFGISSPLWDIVFRTYEAPRVVSEPRAAETEQS